jgi:CRISPR system Cascade subunit CasB
VDSETPDRPSLTSLIGRIAFAVDGVLPTGDVAELRRLDPRDPASPAFFKLMLSMVEPSLDLPPDGPTRDAVERRWAAVFQTTATLAGLHQPQRRLGDALAAAGYSELRLVRLLRAQPEMLPREVRTCSHFLAAKAEPSNLAELARLLVTTDPDKSGSLRRGIARAYYRHQAHDKKEN